jgi:methylmalonyl-CoA mutase cobalamin-binding domain/chain
VKIKARSDRKPFGKIIMGTVKGDIHDIGKKIVATFLKLNGFDVFDIGMNVDANEFIKSAIQEKADIIGLSALLTTTMNEQTNIIRELENRGLRERFKVLVGGAPVTQEWADEISADAYGGDAIDAVKKVKLLLNIQDI